MPLEDRGPELAAVLISLFIFASVAVFLRCCTMGFVLKRFHAEDWLSAITWVFYALYTAFGLVSIRHGLGQHVVDVPMGQHSTALLFKWLGQVSYVIVAVQVKFIVGLLLLRICSHERKQRVTIFILLGFIALFNTFYVFIVIFQCYPVQYFWYRHTPNSPIKGSCNRTKLATIPTYISLVSNVIADFILALLPISFVWNATMDRRTKTSVVAVLGLGSIACLATFARIPYARQILNNRDYLYNFTDLAIWSTVEIGLGLAASSLVTIKPLFRKLRSLSTTRTVTSYTFVSEAGGDPSNSGDCTHDSRTRYTIPTPPRTVIESVTDGYEELRTGRNSLEHEIRPELKRNHELQVVSRNSSQLGIVRAV